MLKSSIKYSYGNAITPSKNYTKNLQSLKNKMIKSFLQICAIYFSFFRPLKSPVEK